jgi:hypothetical protein
MRHQVARALSAGAVGLAALAGSILWAMPAKACSCGLPDLDDALAEGHAVAIVTRTDDGSSKGGDPERLPVATFRVLDSIGPEMPGTLRGEMDTGGSCQPYVAPGSLAALVYKRQDGKWYLGSCAWTGIGSAVQRAQGDPVTATGGPAVAYAAGGFGNARLVALDRTGAAVAWDRTPGFGELVATCPGGRTVVAVGRAESVDGPYTDNFAELTVHDAVTLRVLRTEELGELTRTYGAALRCVDAGAERVQLLVNEGSRAYHADLLTVGDGRVDRVDVGRASMAQAVDGGFVVLGGENTGAVSVALIRPDGRRSTITELPELRSAEMLAVSPDGRTVAVSGATAGEESQAAVVTVDARTGEGLGMFARDEFYATGLEWTRSGYLLVRDSRGYREPKATVHVLDRTSTERGTWPSVAGDAAGRFTAVGDAAVVYGYGSRPTVTPRQGVPLVVTSLRLASAEHLVAVPGGQFATGGVTAEGSDRASDEVRVADDPDRPSADARTLGVVGGVSAAALAAFMVLRRRNRGYEIRPPQR